MTELFFIYNFLPLQFISLIYLSNRKYPLSWGVSNTISTILGKNKVANPVDYIFSEIHRFWSCFSFFVFWQFFHLCFEIGTGHALKSIIKHEGVRGLYKGFWVSNTTILIRQIYFSMYEYFRFSAYKLNPTLLDQTNQYHEVTHF